MPGRGLEPHHRLGLRPRTHARHIVAHLGDPARIAGGADLVEEADGRELRVGRKALVNDRGKRIEAASPRDGTRRDRRVHVAGELAGREPVIDHAAADAEALSDGGLGQAIIEQMLK